MIGRIISFDLIVVNEVFLCVRMHQKSNQLFLVCCYFLGGEGNLGKGTRLEPARDSFFLREWDGKDRFDVQTYTFIDLFKCPIYTSWWFQFFSIFTPIPGEMIQFDDHIFQMG